MQKVLLNLLGPCNHTRLLVLHGNFKLDLGGPKSPFFDSQFLSDSEL